jgi:hypothetical protein
MALREYVDITRHVQATAGEVDPSLESTAAAVARAGHDYRRAIGSPAGPTSPILAYVSTSSTDGTKASADPIPITLPSIEEKEEGVLRETKDAGGSEAAVSFPSRFFTSSGCLSGCERGRSR